MTTPLSEERLAELRRLAALGLRAHVPCTVPAQALTDLLDEVERLRARVAELVAVLQRVEWAATPTGTDGECFLTCPDCLACNEQTHGVHAPDCALDAALRGAGE